MLDEQFEHLEVLARTSQRAPVKPKWRERARGPELFGRPVCRSPSTGQESSPSRVSVVSTVCVLLTDDLLEFQKIFDYRE